MTFIRPRVVACDRCGRALRQTAYAVVLCVFDADDCLVAAALDHKACAAAAMREARTSGGRSEAIPADELDADARSHLRELARVRPGGSVSRVVQKVVALSRQCEAHR